ncbi:MAG: hypothetical protein R8G66_26720 [Cytophagales bacterium]|nr:hypothetical protein [Cytophagales bacterium]
MKLYFLLFLLVSFASFGQSHEVIAITSDERILHGHINDEYPITVYLKVAGHSDNLGYVHAVGGWYKYDKVEIPIPLAGIWTGGQLHLFASEDVNFLKGIENLVYEREEGTQYLDNHIYELESFAENIPVITERFHLDFEEYRLQGKWKNNDKEFWVSLNSSSSEILKTVQFLKLPNGKFFDLSNLSLPGRTNYEIEAIANGGKNILLHYNYHANLNYMGRCGGATTSGKLALVFDESFALLNESQAEFDNCYIDLTVDDLVKVSETITEYTIMDYSSSKKHVYVIDSENATIQKQ